MLTVGTCQHESSALHWPQTTQQRPHKDGDSVTTYNDWNAADQLGL